MKNFSKFFICVTIVVIIFSCFNNSIAAPPSNFQTSLLIGAGLNAPSGVAMAPDGRLFITELTGQIKIYKNGKLLPRFFDELPALANADRGLLGLTFDPDFNTNHYAYFYYIEEGTGFHKVARFNAAGDIATDGPVEIYNSHKVAGSNHAGGTVQFGPDGKLYISIGDSGYSLNSQDMSVPMGKVLRINKDGSVPNDNPFVGQAGKLPEIWAYGFRNPFRFQFDSLTGEMYLGDVGEASWEEINKVVKGGNYGWPQVEGVCDSCSSINPIYTYFHSSPGYSVTGGAVYRGSMFSAAYQGKYFFGDFARGFIKTMNADGTGVVNFDPGVGSVVDIKVGNDGALYYVTINPARLYRVTYTEGNQYPIAKSSASVLEGEEPLMVNFSSSGSSDPEGAPLTYLWNFGDGTISTSTNPTKTFENKGLYSVELKVSDGEKENLAAPLEIKAGTPPTVFIDTPPSGQTYKAGDIINFSSHAQDSEGNALPDGAISREVLFHHNTHFHPFLRPRQEASGSFVIPTVGESATDVYYELRITATDSFGLQTTESVNIVPELSQLTLKTNPPGLQLTVDGTAVNTPHTIEAVSNFEHELDAPFQNSGGMYYEFDHWSDGGEKKHAVNVPEIPGELTAFFRVQEPFVGQYFTNKNLQGEPTLTRNDQDINFDWHQFSPAPEISADNFSVRWTKKQFFPYGRYKFTTASDDGNRLYIDGQLVINDWNNHGEQASNATVDLSKGLHDIKMEYYEDGGGAVARLFWTLTEDQPQPPVFDKFKGEYYDNMDLSGEPFLTRNDENIAFNWQHGPPAPNMPADHFSVRWTRSLGFEEGTYKFITSTDDGVRLFVDGEKIIDQWADQPPTQHTAQKYLTAGSHEIKMEYFENGGGAEAFMSFEKIIPQVQEDPDWIVKFWNAGNGSSPAIPSGDPGAIEHESGIDHDWRHFSPHAGINNDHFIVEWERNINFEEAAYKFNTISDDGIRVYVDGEALIDQWNDHGPTIYSAYNNMPAGVHNLQVQYYENGGGAVAKFSYSKAATTLDEFTQMFYNNQSLSGDPVYTVNNPYVNYVWNMGSIDPSINTDHFSARLIKNQDFSAGNHKFTVQADDGVRLYIDGSLVIDKWIDQPLSTYIANVELTEGEHEVKIEYYENGGEASLIYQED